MASEEPPPEDLPTAAPAAEPDPPERELAASALPYGDSPITGVATELTAAAVAALRGEAIPPLPVPTASGGSGLPEVERQTRGGHDGMPHGEVKVLGFILGLELVLKVGEPRPDAPVDSQAGRLETLLYVGPRGVRVLGTEVRPMEPRPGLPLPPGLGGLEQVGREVLAHLRAGTVEEILAGEPERAILGPRIWREVEGDLLDRERLAQASRAAATLGDVQVTYDIDDAGILARDEEETLFLVLMDFADLDGHLVLDDSPLFRVEPRRPGEDL